MSERIAFLFPGQGSQFVGMGKELAAEHAEAREVFEEADETLGMKLSTLCFEGPLENLTLTQNTQPALLTHSTALFKVLQKETGVKPVFVAGHSLGEYSALVAAGALVFKDAVQAVQNRGKWMQEAVPSGEGGMVALIGVDEAQAQTLCEEVRGKSGIEGVLSVANLNGGGQVVIAGHKKLCDWAVEHPDDLETKPRKMIALNVSAPFHCALMKPAEEKLAAHLNTLPINDLNCPYVANVDAQIHNDKEGIVSRLAEQVCSSVRWEASIQTLLKSGEVDSYWEVGPGKVLTGLMRKIDRAAKAEPKG